MIGVSLLIYFLGLFSVCRAEEKVLNKVEKDLEVLDNMELHLVEL